MTRSDLVEELAARFSQLTHRDAEYAVKTILDAMSEALVRGHRIEIRGFGSFSINRRPPRMDEQRRDVTLDQIAPDLRNAVIAVEDQRFYDHNGVDLIRIGAAVLRNFQEGRRAEGGSQGRMRSMAGR